ncbi:SpoIIE family protein phosphatase [Streptomyces sp. NPDC058964]|uniref:SpoIIE family protein phosphatase n=1 Tax=Streptomyces sp. NPDC058964 TaxID=3346681 RepID=UPI0036BD42CC
MTSEPAPPPESGTAPELTALYKVVARQRAELDRLQDLAATSAVLERAKGALMAVTGCTPDVAHEELVERARTGNRTLIEECWITLGALRPPPDRTADGTGSAEESTPTGTGRARSARTASWGTPAAGTDADSEMLARLGRALVRVGSPRELAVCLLEHLGPDVGADAVMLYGLRPDGGLELVGHAGVDETLAAQWDRIPPLSGVPALEALRSREPRWLEDPATDRTRYVLVADTAERWLSRAWLPVPAAAVALGVLRRHDGPFTPHQRELLRAVARLCAGRLRALDSAQEPASEETTDTLRAVFDALPGAAVLLTPLRAATGEVEDYRIDAATPQAVDVLGRTGRELVGMRILECYPSVAGEPLWQGYLTALSGGEPYEGEPFAYHEIVDGLPETATYSVRATRLGGGLLVTWIRHNHSTRQEQRLADVQRLGNLGWATWNLATLEVIWSPQVYALLERDPARGPVRLQQLPDLVLPEDAPALSRAVTELVGAGQQFDVPFRIRCASGVRHLRIVAEAVADPDGKPIEVHGFVQDLTALRNAELALVESERANLLQRGVLQAERAMAIRLQHALLPLPKAAVRLAGLRVEVAYLPAQSEIHVGGDWFSAIELPGEDALFVIGDVAGHGIDAVATMAQLRFTAKGMVSTGSSLTGALARLNTLLLHSRDSNTTATIVLARYDPEGHRLVWAQAGHLPPLLLRQGEAHYLDRPEGILLGASTSPAYESAECRLEPGDRLLLYTDGLVERPGEGLDVGLARLARAVLADGSEETGSLEELLAAMLKGERRDDVCVLDIRVPLREA